MDNYLNKKVEIREKVFGGITSTSYGLGGSAANKIVGVITHIYAGKFIELDNKILIAIDYIYKIEIVDWKFYNLVESCKYLFTRLFIVHKYKF